jgi:CTP:molybdopterin cytidylyltransferase MocA
MTQPEEFHYDVFLCHASEDKSTVVQPLATALEQQGVHCWSDTTAPRNSDIVDHINRGLRDARMMVAVLSRAFLKKKWPERELYSAVAREPAGRQLVLLVLDSDKDVIKEIQQQYPVLASARFLLWSAGIDDVVKEVKERLADAPNASATVGKPSPARRVCAVAFAAGRSRRFADGQTAEGHSKMLFPVPLGGALKPMLFCVVDLFAGIDIPTLVLTGFEGPAIAAALAKQYGPRGPRCVNVSRPDGSDLEPNTGGTLKKHWKAILEQCPDATDLVFCVGDQPLMRPESIHEFIQDYLQQNAAASLLAAESAGTELARRTSTTRISKTGNTVHFETPTELHHLEHYSTLLDVGVLVISKATFEYAVERIHPNDVFGKLVTHLPPPPSNPIVLLKIDRNPYQFINVNGPDDLKTIIQVQASSQSVQVTPAAPPDRSKVVTDWLAWNVDDHRSATRFSIGGICSSLPLICELDTALPCDGTPACKQDCTFRQRRHHGPPEEIAADDYIDPEIGKRALKEARELGFVGVRPSGR